jgi:hypothetical protein
MKLSELEKMYKELNEKEFKKEFLWYVFKSLLKDYNPKKM